MKRSFAAAAILLAASAAHATTLATATIAAQPSAVVPSSFLGLSMEWCNIQTVMGTVAGGGTNAILAQYIANLRAYGAGPMHIRVGGNSTDTGSSCSTPTGVQSVVAMHDFATATGSKFTFGVNLVTNNFAASMAQATAYCAGMPAGSVLGFEVGNEPDLYSTSGWNATTYYAELAQWLAGLQAAQTCTKSMLGPSFASWNGHSGGFIPSIPGIAVTSANNGMGELTAHFYVGSNLLTSGQLIAANAFNAGFRFFYQMSMAHGLGMKFRVDETNSAYNGGAPAVSNSFESALWIVNHAMGLAADGVDGINLHGGYLAGSGYNYYTPVAITASGGGAYSLVNSGANAATQPLYYGMLFFEKAISGGGPIYPVTLALTPSTANVSAWATVDSGNVTRLVVLNKDTTNSGNIVIANAASTASVCYLTGPALTSLKGVTVFANFANSTSQNFDTSTNGLPTGTVGFDVITPSAGSFTFPMGTAQAAILTFGSSTGC